MIEKQFPNGFTSWMETHHEVVAWFERGLGAPYSGELTKSMIIMEHSGTGGAYEFCQHVTDVFEEENKDRLWLGDFFDEIEQFLFTIDTHVKFSDYFTV